MGALEGLVVSRGWVEGLQGAWPPRKPHQEEVTQLRQHLDLSTMGPAWS